MYNTLKYYRLGLDFFLYISQNFNKVKKAFYIFISLIITTSTMAQQSENSDSTQYSSQSQTYYNLNNEIKGSEQGLITPHFSLDYLHGSVIKANDIPDKNGSNYIQLSFTTNTGTQSGSFFNWYRKPQVGFTGLVGFLGQKDILGNVYAFYPTWNYSLFNEKSIGLNIKLGTGFAWFSKPYDKFDNTQNTLIGSHLTNATEIGLDVWFKFLPQWKIEAGSSFLHFSNGHMAIPNIGLNDITAKIGVIYSPGTLQGTTTKTKHLPSVDTSWKKSIAISLGRHELAYSTYPTDGPSYNIYKIYAGVSKTLTNINEIQFGISAAYYESFHTFIHLTDYYNHFQYLASTVWSLHVAHEFLINRFGFVTDLGIKVIDPFYRSYFLEKDGSLWYKAVFAPRIGFKFYPVWNSFASQRLAMGLFVQTNCGQADFVEYSLSYTF